MAMSSSAPAFHQGPEPVRLDYLVRQTEGMWKIIDVFLNGNISQLAARRSEYSALVREGGARPGRDASQEDCRA